MRWNKQYLDILANKCNFEDEERYTEFLEALNAVANRYCNMWPVNFILLLMYIHILVFLGHSSPLHCIEYYYCS